MDDDLKLIGVALIVNYVVMETVNLLVATWMVRVLDQTLVLVLVLVLELFYEICSCALESVHVGDEIGHLRFCLQSAAVSWNSYRRISHISKPRRHIFYRWKYEK